MGRAGNVSRKNGYGPTGARRQQSSTGVCKALLQGGEAECQRCGNRKAGWGTRAIGEPTAEDDATQPPEARDGARMGITKQEKKTKKRRARKGKGGRGRGRRRKFIRVLLPSYEAWMPRTAQSTLHASPFIGDFCKPVAWHTTARQPASTTLQDAKHSPLSSKTMLLRERGGTCPGRSPGECQSGLREQCIFLNRRQSDPESPPACCESDMAELSPSDALCE
jgi:hypothetical protein